MIILGDEANPLSLGFTAMVDDEDYDRLANRGWHVIKAKHTQYAVWYRTRRDKVLMHREILMADIFR